MRKGSILQLLKYIVTMLGVILFALPLILVIINSFKSKAEIMTSAIAMPSSFNLENYRTIMADSNFLTSFLTSIFVVTVTTSLTLLISAITGYALARWESRLSKIILIVIMTTLFVPFQVYMVALIVIVKNINLIGSLFGLIIVYIALGMPVPIFLCRSYCIGLSKDIEEAAIIDGCSRIKMIGVVILPLMRPILATVAVLNALWVWGEFLVAFLVYGSGKPMTLPLSQRYFFGTYSNQWNLILTNFLISSIPIIILYILMQKNIIKGIVAGAIKG
ncbi:MAG: carbohydrate ABC transporter permease [Lachnospiraceae bacterium]